MLTMCEIKDVEGNFIADVLDRKGGALLNALRYFAPTNQYNIPELRTSPHRFGYIYRVLVEHSDDIRLAKRLYTRKTLEKKLSKKNKEK